MKYLPNFFRKGALQKLFFLFPDPHFKTANHRRRIIQRNLIAEYAYLLSIGGVLYTVSDVEELGTWMSNKLIAHRCFQRLTASELEHDPIIAIITNQTEEGRKVQRNEGTVYVNVFERVAGPG